MTDEDNSDQREWAKLSRQRPYAGTLIYVGAALFLFNIFGSEEPYNNTLATLTMIIAIGGGFWFWHLTNEMKRITARR